MCPGRTPLSVTTTNAFTPPSTFSTLSSATFVALDLIFNLWNTTSPLLNLIFFSSPKHNCLRQLTVAHSLFPPTFSIFISFPKLDVASTYATTFFFLFLYHTCSRVHALESSEFSTIWLPLNSHSLTKFICAVYLS
ncbi:hypothetical protein E2C01_092714 [Portunus trituberculatus]|uniref:Uncharacterized protein n=1 Tax=Portunus trituberculatus TaxID=210409 RepID=A0A5B7JRA5_PORTR|nr:hypothetical protein [Portunus trituberculatus]